MRKQQKILIPVLFSLLAAACALVLTISPTLAQDVARIRTEIRQELTRLGIIDASGTYSGGLSGLGATDNALVRTDGTGGDRVQGSSVTVDDSGNLTIPASAGVVIGGATSGVRVDVDSGVARIRKGDGTAYGPELRVNKIGIRSASDQIRTTLEEFSLNLNSAGAVLFAPTTTLSTPDTGLKRASAGVVQVTDGGSGGGALRVGTYTVATLPSASTVGAGTIVYVSDGAAGSPCLAFSDGTGWLRVDTLAAVSSS